MRVLQALALTACVGSAVHPALAAPLWLLANQTGASRLRAGVPPGWRVGDKTGTGNHGTTNDVAIVWPPDQPTWRGWSSTPG